MYNWLDVADWIKAKGIPWGIAFAAGYITCKVLS